MEINVPTSVQIIISIFMIYEFLLIITIAALFIKGFHAITRQDKLLHFLGFDEAKRQQKIDQFNQWRDNKIEDIEHEINHKLDRVPLDNEHARTAIQKEGQNKVKEANRELKQRIDSVPEAPAIANPWSECEICMSSIWGTLVTLLHYNDLLFWTWQGFPVLAFPIGLVSLAGAMSLITKQNSE